MRNLVLISILALTAVTASGCRAERKADSGDNKDTKGIETLTAEQAKNMMEQDEEVIILDVRTEEEYRSGHIKGAILIPDYELQAKAEEILTDKEAVILVYCRSGRRSALAAEALSDMGYQKIYDFGGILDWPYEIIVE